MPWAMRSAIARTFCLSAGPPGNRSPFRVSFRYLCKPIASQCLAHSHTNSSSSSSSSSRMKFEGELSPSTSSNSIRQQPASPPVSCQFLKLYNSLDNTQRLRQVASVNKQGGHLPHRVLVRVLAEELLATALNKVHRLVLVLEA